MKQKKLRPIRENWSEKKERALNELVKIAKEKGEIHSINVLKR